MNYVLWVLQVLLALHTAAGAFWKFTNPVEQAVPSLAAIPHPVWLALGVLELVIAVCLVAPAMKKSWAKLAPLAAAALVVEMIVFSGVHFAFGSSEHGQVIYWLVVAALSAFIAAIRFKGSRSAP